jgi:hypothetical protein
MFPLTVRIRETHIANVLMVVATGLAHSVRYDCVLATLAGPSTMYPGLVSCLSHHSALNSSF